MKTQDRFSAPLQDEPKCNKGTPAIGILGSGDRGREPLTLDQQYWLDRRVQIIEALAAEGLEIWSDKDRVWLHRIRGGREPSKGVLLTASKVAEMLDYNPETGGFVWKVKTSNVNPGDVAGYRNGSGYIVLSIGGRRFRAHRVAWLLSYGRWPALVINHINGIKVDNRLANLEEVSVAENTIHAHRTGLIKRAAARKVLAAAADAMGNGSAAGHTTAEFSNLSTQAHGYGVSESVHQTKSVSVPSVLPPMSGLSGEAK